MKYLHCPMFAPTHFPTSALESILSLVQYRRIFYANDSERTHEFVDTVVEFHRKYYPIVAQMLNLRTHPAIQQQHRCNLSKINASSYVDYERKYKLIRFTI